MRIKMRNWINLFEDSDKAYDEGWKAALRSSEDGTLSNPYDKYEDPENYSSFEKGWQDYCDEEQKEFDMVKNIEAELNAKKANKKNQS